VRGAARCGGRQRGVLSDPGKGCATLRVQGLGFRVQRGVPLDPGRVVPG